MAETTVKTMSDELRQAAKGIAAYLFANGDGTKAERLVLTSADGKDLGGWCEQAVVDAILSHLPTRLRMTAEPDPEINGADLNLFCAVTKVLGRRYPKRAAAEPINDLVPLLVEVQTLYKRLPLVQEPASKRRKK